MGKGVWLPRWSDLGSRQLLLVPPCKHKVGQGPRKHLRRAGFLPVPCPQLWSESRETGLNPA